MNQPVSHSADGPILEASDLNQFLIEELIQLSTIGEFANAWLTLQCTTIPGCIAGAVFQFKAAGDIFDDIASWKSGDDDSSSSINPKMAAAARGAHAESAGIIIEGSLLSKASREGSDRGCYLVVQVMKSGMLWGYAVLHVDSADRDLLRVWMERLQWSTAWYQWFFGREAGGTSTEENEALENAVMVLAAMLGQLHYKQAALTLVNETATTLKCDRVSFGEVTRHRVFPIAISGTVMIDVRAESTHRIVNAMEEAVDQFATLAYPPIAHGQSATRYIYRAHETLSTTGTQRCNSLSVLLRNGETPIGVLTLERASESVFTQDEIEILEATSELIAPILQMKRRDDRYIISKVIESFSMQWKKLVGAGHAGRKAIALLILAMVVFFNFAKWDYQVSADAIVEAKQLQAATVPFDGFLKGSGLRAGDIVKKGDVLATLDDSNLRLQHLTNVSRRQEVLREHKKALGERRIADANIIEAQIAQIDAELALTEARLAQTKIVAPFDGVVASGDLSQVLGAPLRQGDILFEIAPLDHFRLVLQVEDRDIAELDLEEHVDVRLLARPYETYSLRTTRMAPISTVQDEQNVFRVEAEFDESLDWLRPGMEGVAKVDVGRRRIIWIWTHRITEFIRLKLWI